MANIYKSVEDIIGNTPLLELTSIEKMFNLDSKILAKLEFLNPAGSAKDRVAVSMLNEAEKDGTLKNDGVIIEPTSGNTGIGLAAVCAKRGYKLVIVMPSTMSKERQTLMKAYGAKLVLSDGKLGMSGAIKKAEELKKEMPNSIIAGQFVNPANPKAHYMTTGPEIWRDTDGKVDILVAGVGTGGTISGTGKYLKEQNKDIKVVAIEPKASAVLSGEKAGAHGIQGIGAGFIPDALDTYVYDEVIKVSDDDSYKFARHFGTLEGFLAGISSGAALAGAIELAKRKENKNKNIVVIIPDTGDRYLSTSLYE